MKKFMVKVLKEDMPDFIPIAPKHIKQPMLKTGIPGKDIL